MTNPQPKDAPMSTHQPPPPPPPSPAPPPGGAWRRFRSSPRWAQATAWAGAALVALIIIGAVAGDPEADQASSSTPAPPAATTAPTAPAPAPPPEDVDTGRMSDGEFASTSSALDRVNQEVVAYGEKIGGECAAIYGAGEVSAGIECVKDAYDGVEGALGSAVFTLEDVRDDVAKRCRATVEKVRKVADVPLFRALRGSRDALVAFDLDAAQASAGAVRRETARWQRLQVELALECSPELG